MKTSFITPENTVAEAKQFLRDSWEFGVECPCCTQFVKVYKRKITSSMARVAIAMYNWHVKNGFSSFLQVNDYLIDIKAPAAMQADFPKMRFWDLVEQKDDVRNDGSKRVGYWRLTDLGKMFVEKKCEVPQYMRLFNNKSYGAIGRDVGIVEALGSNFSYSELMLS